MSYEVKLSGPKKSKLAINEFESWLPERCRNGPVKVETVEREYQYLSGHEPRKIRQYLRAIETSGKIRLLFNGGAEYCEWIGDRENKYPPKKDETKKPDDFVISSREVGGIKFIRGTYVGKDKDVENSEAKQTETIEDETATEYMRRRNKEKEERIRDGLAKFFSSRRE
jgi:hypothetical protein